ncbi:MAG: hypothetical protein ACRDNJ_15540, partial [Solirubrobacteraceae bacterium]
VYDDYLTLDLLALPAAERELVAGFGCRALSCVAPVGERRSELPPGALAAAASLLADDALVVYMHDPAAGAADAVSESWWSEILPVRATLLARERYVHRLLADGGAFEMDGVAWRLERDV